MPHCSVTGVVIGEQWGGFRQMKEFLIVDDSRVVRRVARQILEEFQFTISEAEDGQVALASCKKHMPDAILLDWNMPNMNGIEFLRALRKEQDGDRPVVLFCTSASEISFITRAMEAGANEYIMKPFDKDIIQSKLAEVGLC